MLDNWGTTSSMTFHPGACFAVVDQDVNPTNGISQATIGLSECCTDILRISSSGQSFTGRPYATSFNLASQPAAFVAPAPTCVRITANPTTVIPSGTGLTGTTTSTLTISGNGHGARLGHIPQRDLQYRPGRR